MNYYEHSFIAKQDLQENLHKNVLNKFENISVATIRLGGIYSDEKQIKKSTKS